MEQLLRNVYHRFIIHVSFCEVMALKEKKLIIRFSKTSIFFESFFHNKENIFLSKEFASL